MGRYSSDSDSDPKGRSGLKKSKKKSKSRKRRSRSSSYESRRPRDTRKRSSRSRSRSSNRSREDRRRRYRSRSRDSYDSRRVSRKSRSRTPRRYRSRSRSHSRERGYSRGKNRSRSRSRSRDKSSRRKKSSRNHSRSRDKSTSPRREKVAAKPKDPCENIPGFAEMTPSQQSRIRIQAAFKVADAAIQKEVPADTQAVASAIEQLDRAQVIQDIEDEGFMPSHFTSSRSNKTKENAKSSSWPTNLADQENYHEMAIFGNSNALGLDEKTKKEISEASEMSVGKLTIKWDQRDLKTLAHPNLSISFEDAERRWLDKLKCMRMVKMKAR